MIAKLECRNRTINRKSASHVRAPRYSLEQGWAFARQPRQMRFKYKARLSDALAKLIANSAYNWTIKGALEKCARLFATECMWRFSHGYIALPTLYAVLREAKLPPSNIGTFIKRSIKAGILITVEAGLYKVACYNHGNLARQNALVQDLNSRVTKKSIKTATYKKPKRYEDTPYGVTSCVSGEVLEKTEKKKNNLSTLAPASPDGIGSRIVPAAKQGLGASTLPRKPVILPSVQAETVFCNTEKPPKEKKAREKKTFANLPKGFAIPQLRDDKQEQQRHEFMGGLRVTGACEANTRGFHDGYYQGERLRFASEANRRRRKDSPLVPVSATSATFMDYLRPVCRML